MHPPCPAIQLQSDTLWGQPGPHPHLQAPIHSPGCCLGLWPQTHWLQLGGSSPSAQGTGCGLSTQDHVSRLLSHQRGPLSGKGLPSRWTRGHVTDSSCAQSGAWTSELRDRFPGNARFIHEALTFFQWPSARRLSRLPAAERTRGLLPMNSLSHALRGPTCSWGACLPSCHPQSPPHRSSWPVYRLVQGDVSDPSLTLTWPWSRAGVPRAGCWPGCVSVSTGTCVWRGGDGGK